MQKCSCMFSLEIIHQKLKKKQQKKTYWEQYLEGIH